MALCTIKSLSKGLLKADEGMHMNAQPRPENGIVAYKHRVIVMSGDTPQEYQRFIQLGSFQNDWKRLGMNDEDLRALKILIMIRPSRFPVVPGTGGLRKLRLSAKDSHRGKSGGIRVGYAYFPKSTVVTLLVAYGKDEQDDLSPDECRQIKALIEWIEDSLDKGA